MDEREYRARQERSNRRWNLIIFGAFLLFAPAGVAMLIAKLLNILPNIGGNIDLAETIGRSFQDFGQKNTAAGTGTRQQTAGASTAPGPSATSGPSGSSGPRATGKTAEKMAEVAAEKAAAAAKAAEQEAAKAAAKNTKSTQPGMPGGNGALIFSGLAAVVFGMGFGLSRLVSLLEGFSIGGLIAMAGWFSLAAAGGVLALYGGIRKRKRRRFEAYLKLIGDKEYVSIHELADVLGMDYRKVIRDLREMIQRGILSPAWLDMKTYRLMLTEYTGETVAEKKEEYLPRSERILRQIRADNDLIADEEVSRKIDRIEDLTRKIFAIVDKFPEKENQLYSFLNYYLPTTLKALENYARLEAQGIETASIREAKQKINLMLDELADGYEKQLDRLFENDVVDISADIEVMRQMLQKDGLTEDEIMKQKA